MDSIYKPTGKAVWQDELLCLCDSYLKFIRDHGETLENMLSMSVEGPAQIFVARFEEIISPVNLVDLNNKDVIDLSVDYLHFFALAIVLSTLFKA